MSAPLHTQSVSPLLVGIGGGSDQSSLVQALVTILGATQTARLAHDAYYRDGGGRTPRDYDVPDAFDRGLFVEHLAALRAGHPIRPPTYCLVTHRRTGQAAILVPRAIVLIEGGLLLWEPAVRAALDLKIYLDGPTRDARRDYVEPTRAMADLVLSTAGRIQPLAEIAAAVILDRLARHRGQRARIAS